MGITNKKIEIFWLAMTKIRKTITFERGQKRANWPIGGAKIGSYAEFSGTIGDIA